jgi:hypothetical protein
MDSFQVVVAWLDLKPLSTLIICRKSTLNEISNVEFDFSKARDSFGGGAAPDKKA